MEIFCVKIAASYMFNKLLNATLQSLTEKVLVKLTLQKSDFFSVNMDLFSIVYGKGTKTYIRVQKY